MPTDLFSGLSLNLDLFEILKIALGIYLIWGAITGKGKVMLNEFPKCSPEKYKKLMRIFLGITGPVVVISGVLTILGIATTSSDDPNQVWGWVLWGLGLALLVGIVVFNIVMTDRKAAEAAMKAKETARPHPSDPLHDAFEFGNDKKEEPERETAIGKDETENYTYKSDAERGENKDPRWY